MINMRIVVCIKQVPDTREIRVDPETNNLIRNGVPSIMNPHDMEALKQALAIKADTGAEVVTVSMGPGQAVEILQESLDMGADGAVLLSDRAFAGADTLATGYTLSAAAKKLNADVIFCGAEAIDGCTAQVGPIIAEELGWPHFTHVTGLEIKETRSIVTREIREGVETYECEGPFVACIAQCAAEFTEPGAASDRKPEIWNLESLYFEPDRIGMRGSPTKVTKVIVSGKNTSGFIMIDGSLPVRERIRRIVNGGIEPQKVSLIRESPGTAAGIILNEEILRNRLLS